MKKVCSFAIVFLLSGVAVPSADADETVVSKTLAEYVDVFNQKAAEKVAGYRRRNAAASTCVNSRCLEKPGVACR